jgi:hypothetical protein
MSHKDARFLRDIIMVVGFIVMIAGYLYTPLSVIGAIVMLSCLIPDYLYNRCPHCKNRLGRNCGPFCQHCGGNID